MLLQRSQSFFSVPGHQVNVIRVGDVQGERRMCGDNDLPAGKDHWMLEHAPQVSLPD